MLGDPSASASSSARTNAPAKAGTLTPSRRSFLLKLHLWLGLSLGGLLALIGLSGSAMIFRFELERLCFPALMRTHSEPGSVNLDACMRAARAVNAAKTVRSVRLPVRADDTLEWITIPAGETTKVHATYVYTDPFTCSVLGTRGPKKDVMSFLVNFHHALFLGKVGAIVQVVVALATVTLIVVGLILWLPKTWTWSHVRPRASARPLHYAIGFWRSYQCSSSRQPAPIWLGVWRSFRHCLHGPAAKPVVSSPKATAAVAEPPSGYLNAAIGTARQARPEAVLRSVTLPQKVSSVVCILYQFPGEYGRAANNTMTLKPGKDGSLHVASIVEARGGSTLRRLLNGLMQVHYGEFAGIGSRLLWCATGFAPTILFGSGLLIWRRRLRALQVTHNAVAARAALRAEALSLK
jgi:uncharacterized iron-regulated membrane protein